MNNTLCILLIDDSLDDRTLAIRELRREILDLQVQQITEAKGFAQALEGGNFDLVITDYRLRWTDGLEVLRAVKARWPECPVIMFTDVGTEETAVEAMKAGLDEYVIKLPRHFARLPVAVRLALKRAQQRQALKEAEARYRSLFDGVPVGLYRTTPEGQALDANVALVQMLGYPNRESLLMVSAADTYASPDGRRRWQVLMEREGVVRDFEAQLRRYDGTIIWVRDSAQAVRDSDGRVLYYEGVMEDITERKRTEEAFRRERGFSQSIVETTSALVMVLDADGRITLFNRACEELTGYTATETIGCVMWKFLIPERFVPGVQEAFSKRLRADVPPGNYEIPLLTRDDNERWITWTYTNVRDEAGDVTAIVGIGVDVTDFRRVQQTLERRNRELQALVEAGQLLSGTLDLDKVLDRVLDVVQKQFNLASVSFSSYDPATQTFEIRAQHYDVPAHQVGRIGERRTRDQHPYSSRALDTGQPVYEPDLWTAPHIPEEKRAEARAKNIRSVVEVPLVAKGQPVGVLHLRSFETPRFFTEEELAFVRAIAPGAAAAIDNARLYGQIDAARARAEGLAARVVQAQEEERRRIARELHDEVGQLLTGAKLSQEMLVADLPAELAELRERALENVDLIDETMDVVRKLSLDLRPAALDELGLRAALEWHIERYQHRTGLQVILRQEAFPSQLPDPLATAVYRIIQEALTNVARHASAESIVVEVACAGRSLCVQVTDDGCGFDAATVLRTGLAEGHFGLVGLQERATLLSGKARIESAPGKGTRIAVELPLPECE